jgi:alanine-synthesizing transaminase
VSLSRRTRWPAVPNALTRALEARTRQGLETIDLTVSNPTAVGLSPLDDPGRAALAHPDTARYAPDPRGIASARRAVAGYYADRGVTVDPDHIVLTASTSEAYGWLFKLLCDPGDHVCVAHPSYPLFDDLAALEGVTLDPFALDPDTRWALDLPPVDPGVRALLLVHPNNPTGRLLRRAERDAAARWCADADAALVVDEVFLDAVGHYPRDACDTFADEARCLTFVLSGLSKVAALPQLKLGWIVVTGPAPRRDEALRRLEHLADCYLSVSAPVQHALPTLLAGRHRVQSALRARVATHRDALTRAFADTAVTVLPADAGWYAVVRLPRTAPDEAWALRALDAGVLVHPGYLFDFAGEGFAVVSLLAAPEEFSRGLAGLRAAWLGVE